MIKDTMEKQSRIIDMQETGFREIESEISTLKRKQQIIQNKLQDAESESQSWKKEHANLKNILQKLKTESNEGQQSFDNEIKVLRNDIADKESRLQVLDSQLSAVLDKKSVLEERGRNIRDNLNHIEGAIRNQTKEQLQKERNPLEDFKQALHRSLQLFQKRPMGPICDHLSLVDYSWRSSVDAVIGQYMDNFIVFSHKDRETLTNLMNRSNVKYPILLINQNSAQTNADSNSTYENTIPLRRILSISERDVEQALTVFEGLDRILLAANRDVAVNVMSCRPKNIDSILTKKEKIQASRGSVSVFQLYPSSNSHLLKASSKSSSGENYIDDLKSRESMIKSELNTLQVSSKQIYDEEMEIRRSIVYLRNDLHILRLQYDTRSSNHNSFQSSTAIEDQIKEIEISIEDSTKQFVGLAKSIKALENESLLMTDQISTKEKELQYSRAQHSKTLAEYEGLAQRFQSLNRLLSNINHTREKFYEAMKSLETSRASLQEKVEEMMTHALKVGHRVYTSRTIEEVDEMLHEENVRIAARRLNQIDVNAVTQRLNGLLKRFNHLSDLRDEISHSSESIGSSTTRRIHALNLFRKMISRRSSIEFSNIMNSRGFNADLHFEHEVKKLHISVISNATKDAHLDVKQLSGGEKSFGTSCFLLSLWDCIGSPFRFLDEFDVFMDSVNRRIILELIFQQSKITNTQCIIITPIPLNCIGYKDSDIKIIALKDARS